MDTKQVIDVAKSLSDVLDKRFMILKMLLFPVTVIILANSFEPSKVEPLKKIIPHYNWIDVVLKTQDSMFHLLASAAFYFVAVVFIWAFLSKRLGQLFRKDWEPNWSKPIRIGLGYLFECSAWWLSFYGFSILYADKPTPLELILGDYLPWPVIIIFTSKIVGWISLRE